MNFLTGSGDEVNGLRVTLYNDPDGDAVGDSVRLRDFTNSNGIYAWDVPSGCYVVGFTLLSEQRILEGSPNRPACISPGQELLNVNLVITLPRIDPVSYCEVQLGNSSYAGVEIHDSAADWADSYSFYDRNGRFLLNTTSLGAPDNTEPHEPSIEWESTDFEESLVYSVAAVHAQGAESARKTCVRFNV